MKLKLVKLVFLFAIIASCNTEIRTYKRVGGVHLHLKSAKKELFWFNGIHGNNPKNPMFNDIKTELKKFKPSAVFVEGHFHISKHKDELSAIKSGECSYVAFLSKSDKIDCFNIEPTDSALNAHLIRKFSKKEVITMYLIRQMVQWGRNKKKIADFEKTAIDYLKWENKTIGFFNDEITQESISDLLNPHSKMENINNTNWEQFDAKKYLYFSKNKINKVYEETSNYRNIYMVEEIGRKLKDYDRVFIMMGFDHAKEMKSEIVNIFNKS